jgi:hypothetical protein
VSPDGDDKEDWVFSTKALVIWGLTVLLAGVIVGQLLMIAAFAMGWSLPK